MAATPEIKRDSITTYSPRVGTITASEQLDLLASRAAQTFWADRLTQMPAAAWLPCDPQTKAPTCSWRTTEMRGQGSGRPKKEVSVYHDKRSEFKPLDHNLGFQTGAINKCTVVDVDLANDGYKYWLAFIVDDNSHDHWYWVRTGTGGLHIYFDYEPELATVAKAITHDGKRVGIDVRNDGGFVVAAGSTHANGHRYTENRDLATFTAGDAKFPKMPLWLKRLVTPHAEIRGTFESGFVVQLPTDPRPDAPSRWNVTVPLLRRLVESLPPDVAFTRVGWSKGLRALTRIVEEHRLRDDRKRSPDPITEIAEIFIKKANSGTECTYDPEGGLREFGGAIKTADPGVKYLVDIARTYQLTTLNAPAFAALEAELRAPLPPTHLDMVRLACADPSKTREDIEDLMLGCIFALHRNVNAEWVVILEDGLTPLSKTMPYSTRGNNIAVPHLPGKPTCFDILSGLVASPRWTSNIYSRIDCIPTFTATRPVVPRVLNTFRKFGAQITTPAELKLNLAGRPTRPNPRGAAALLEHLFAELCGESRTSYDYVISWLAHLVQKPTIKPASALVFSGPPGSGKNTFWDFIAAHVIGRDYTTYLNSIDRATSHFNANLSHKALIVLNEASTWSGAHATADRLKSMISDKEITVEPKGCDPYSVSDFSRIVILTNHESPVRIEAGDRRYCICASYHKVPLSPDYYTALHKILADSPAEIAQDLVNYFAPIDIATWAPQGIPESAMRTDIKIRCLSPILRWMYLILSEDDQVRWAPAKRALTKELGCNVEARAFFAQYCAFNPKARAEDYDDWKKFLNGKLGLKTATVTMPDKSRPTGFLLRRDTLRAAFRVAAGTPDLVFEKIAEEEDEDDFGSEVAE